VAASDALSAAERIATGVAAAAAADVDRRARFPTEAIQALRDARLLGAGVPGSLGGLGLGVPALAEIAQTLAQGCAATAMVWAMHQIQVACIVRHGAGVLFFEDYLRSAVERQLLIASITSEVGVGGDIRTSLASVEPAGVGGQCQLSKHGATISYGASADAFLATARRCPAAPSDDQVLILLQRPAVVLEQTSTWDTLGMRGTCSPAFRATGQFASEQILPAPFADICAQTMVPFSHILWSACWLGIATDAVRRARAYLRARARREPTRTAGDHRLAVAASALQQMRANVFQTARSYADSLDQASSAALPTLGMAVEMNQLKLATSELVVDIVSQALGICGMQGYQADGPYSVARHLRDAYSAACMISNERLREANASMLLLQKAI
jgi:acyl-CoA dehydrogenase